VPQATAVGATPLGARAPLGALLRSRRFDLLRHILPPRYCFPRLAVEFVSTDGDQWRALHPRQVGVEFVARTADGMGQSNAGVEHRFGEATKVAGYLDVGDARGSSYVREGQLPKEGVQRGVRCVASLGDLPRASVPRWRGDGGVESRRQAGGHRRGHRPRSRARGRGRRVYLSRVNGAGATSRGGH